jgi:uncharacterized protein YfdQ (DUF2303 family)
MTKTPSEPDNQAETIADLARKASVVQQVTGTDGRMYLIVPDGYSAKDVTDPHGLFPRTPSYIKQRVEVQALDSLVDYVNAFKTPHTKLFADIMANSITGLIDYHQEDAKAANVAHAVTMALPFSEEWKLWTGIDGKLMGQLEFARFLEENHPDIVQPNAAELIEIARDLHAARSIKLTKVVRTESDNESFVMDDSTSLQSGKAGADKVEIPRQFTLSIPIYFGESPIDMTAFLRWKLEPQEGMKLGIKMWRPEHVRQAMFKQIVTGAAERTTLTAVYGKTTG